MIFNTNTLFLAASVAISGAKAAAVPAPVPTSPPSFDQHMNHFEKRQGGAKLSRFGGCLMPASVTQPMYPHPTDFRKYTGKVPTANVNNQKGKDNKAVLEAIPRWWVSTLDLTDLNAGMKVGQMQSVAQDGSGDPDPDDIAEINKDIIVAVMPNPTVATAMVMETGKVNMDHVWETNLMEKFITSKLNSVLNGPYDKNDAESQECDDFKTTILTAGSKPIQDIYNQMPGYDPTQPTGAKSFKAEFIGMDAGLNSAKGVVFSRRWGQYPSTQLTNKFPEKQTAMGLITTMERTVNIFKMMNDPTSKFADTFETTNQRLYNAMKALDVQIGTVGVLPATVKADWAASFKAFIQNELLENEAAAWAWFQKAVPAAEALIDSEKNAGTLAGNYLTNLEARCATLKTKTDADFQFADHNIANPV